MAEKDKEQMATKKQHHCPYCDEEIRQMNLPWCQACGVSIVYCSRCSQPVAKERKTCPHCGATLTSR